MRPIASPRAFYGLCGRRCVVTPIVHVGITIVSRSDRGRVIEGGGTESRRGRASPGRQQSAVTMRVVNGTSDETDEALPLVGTLHPRARPKKLDQSLHRFMRVYDILLGDLCDRAGERADMGRQDP
jgi:hypothetical protein